MKTKRLAAIGIWSKKDRKFIIKSERKIELLRNPEELEPIVLNYANLINGTPTR